MKNIISLLLIIITFSNASSSEFIELGGEIRLPLPESWQVASNSGQFPFQIINAEQSAELLIYKSLIAKGETIKTNQELKASVDIIITDIVLELPEAKLLSSTGEIDENRAIFSLDFISVDTITIGQIFHRLNGYLYDHPDKGQILFTLWGKTSSSDKEILHKEILLMQNNFSYYGESNEIMFQADEETDWKIFIIILFIIVLVLMFFRKYKASDSIQFSEDSHFWRCSCGRQNHNNHDSCRRCGQKNKIKESV